MGLVFVLSVVKDSDATAVQRELEQITLAIFTIERADANTPPADVDITIEGVLHDLEDMASALHSYWV